MIPDRALLAAGLVLAVVVGVAAVFLASPDPDGLDSTALVTQGQKDLTGPAAEGAEVDESALPGSFEYAAPFADYTLGGSPIGDAALMVAGTLLALVAVLGLARALKAAGRARAP